MIEAADQQSVMQPIKASHFRKSGAGLAETKKGYVDVERLPLWQLQAPTRSSGRVYRAPDQMFPVRDVESCEGLEPRAIASERPNAGEPASIQSLR